MARTPWPRAAASSAAKQRPRASTTPGSGPAGCRDRRCFALAGEGELLVSALDAAGEQVAIHGRHEGALHCLAVPIERNGEAQLLAFEGDILKGGHLVHGPGDGSGELAAFLLKDQRALPWTVGRLHRDLPGAVCTDGDRGSGCSAFGGPC